MPPKRKPDSDIPPRSSKRQRKPVARASAPPDAQPKPRSRKRKPAQPAHEDADGRTAPFLDACPQKIQDRVKRVLSQTFYMIDRSRVPGELKEEFSVLGSTGNVYTVTIDRKPRCNCPDALMGNHCKHILFVYFKVLQVPEASTVWYQKALIPSELESIFERAPLAPNSIAHSHIREAHARATGKLPLAEEPDGATTNKRIPGPEDDCPICYDAMHDLDENALVWCKECGNALHVGCFEQWKTAALNKGNPLTCVYCRADWVLSDDAAAAGGKRVGTVTKKKGRRFGGYLNLSGAASGS